MINDKCANPTYINGHMFACGKCKYCRAKRALEWTIRGKHEAITEPKRIFVTLTYNDKSLKITAKRKECPKDEKGTLVKKDLQNFMKRFRKYISPKRCKFIACGEYGEDNFRPHYHIYIYGISNKEISKDELTTIWGKGLVDIDTKPVAGMKAVAYTVGYINKKITDNHSWEHYEGNNREPPFQTQSQGIGLNWSEKFDNWYINCQTGHNGKNCGIPRYYIKKVYEKEGGKIRLDNTIITARDCNISHYELINGDLFQGKYILDGRTISINTKKSKYYKIFINPNGEKTAIILKQMHEKGLERLEKAKNTYKISDKDFAIMRAKYNAEHQQKLNKINQEWNDYCRLSNEELKTKYEHTTVRFTNRIFQSSQSIFIPFDNNVLNKIQTNAKHKEEHLKNCSEKYHKNKLENSQSIEKLIKSLR